MDIITKQGRHPTSPPAAAAAAGLLRPGTFLSPPLHCITERATLEGGGRTLQQEIEAAAALDSQALAEVEVEVEAEVEAAAPEQQQLQQAWDEASPSPPPPPEIEVQQEQELVGEGGDTRVLIGHGKALKQHFFPLDSSSPGSSPGIQAVHNASDVAAEQAAVVEAFRPGGGDGSGVPLPHSQQGAASSPPAQHEADLEQRALSIRPASSSGGSGAGGLLSSPFAVREQQQAAASSNRSSTEEQLKQLCLPLPSQQRDLSRQASEEGEDVFARFTSFQEMEAHFQRVAAAGGLQQLQADAAAAMAAEDGAGISRFGSLRHHPSAADAVDITAASSFSGGWEGSLRCLYLPCLR